MDTELGLMGIANITLLVSTVEQEMLKKYTNAETFIVPNIWNASADPPQLGTCAHRSGMLFVGTKMLVTISSTLPSKVTFI